MVREHSLRVDASSVRADIWGVFTSLAQVEHPMPAQVPFESTPRILKAGISANCAYLYGRTHLTRVRR